MPAVASIPLELRMRHDVAMEAIDHVVIAVPSLAAGTEWFRDAGFVVTRGGRHDALPTENVLVALADGSYLELLAAREPQAREEWRAHASGPDWERHLRGVSAVARRFLPSLAGRDGVVDVCLRGKPLRTRAADLRRIGERAAGPVRMSRERPDGERLEWELLLPESRMLPFWIADRTPRERRVPFAAAATDHPNGATGLVGFGVRAHGAPLAALAIGDLFGSVPRARANGIATIDAGAFHVDVMQHDAEGIVTAMLAGCGELPAGLHALGLRAADPRA